MSLKDELNAIKDANDNEATIKAKFNSPENVDRITKIWIDSWVEVVLKNIEINIKNKVKKGEYEKCGDHNIVHNAFTLYDENHTGKRSYNALDRTKNIIGVLSKDEFPIDKETLSYLVDKSFISAENISISKGEAKLFYNEYGGTRYPDGKTYGICLYVTGGRGIKFNYRCVKENFLMSEFKKLLSRNTSTLDYDTHVYESLTIGDIGKYIIDRFQKRAPAYDFKTDVYVEYVFDNAPGQIPKSKFYDISQLMSEVDLGLFSGYTIPDFFLVIDFSIEF